MPFGGSCEFADFDACVAANQDKASPDGYCAALMAATEASCATSKTDAMKYVYQTVTAATLQSSTELATCMISTINPDREGDRVVPEGGNFDNFMKSPVLMWAHGGTDGYASVPIGSVTALEVLPGHGVRAEWKWLDGDPFAERIKNAWKQGVVRASSIGFKPLTFLKNGTGNDISTWELLELSLCAIPMNPEAVRSLKALGLMGGTEVLRMADEEEVDEAEEEVEDEEISDGPQPTPSVPPKPVMVTEPEDEAVENPEQKEHGETLQTISTLLTQLTTLVSAMQSEGYDIDDTSEDISVQLSTAKARNVVVMRIVDDHVEPTYSVDMTMLRAAIADAVQSSLAVPAMETFQKAINLARGRVH